MKPTRTRILRPDMFPAPKVPEKRAKPPSKVAPPCPACNKAKVEAVLAPNDIFE